MKSADFPDIQPVMPPFLAPAMTTVAWIAFIIAIVGTVLLVVTILRQDDSARALGGFVIAIGGVFLALVLAITGPSGSPSPRSSLARSEPSTPAAGSTAGRTRPVDNASAPSPLPRTIRRWMT